MKIFLHLLTLFLGLCRKEEERSGRDDVCAHVVIFVTGYPAVVPPARHPKWQHVHPRLLWNLSLFLYATRTDDEQWSTLMGIGLFPRIFFSRQFTTLAVNRRRRTLLGGGSSGKSLDPVKRWSFFSSSRDSDCSLSSRTTRSVPYHQEKSSSFSV